MNWLDIAILIVLATSFFAGLKNGLIKTVISFAGMIIGIIMAGRYYHELARYLTFIPQATLANIAAFAGILLAILTIAIVLAAILTKIVSVMLLGWLNRLAGGAFGILTGAAICSALLAIWIKWSGPSSIVIESQLAAILLDKLPIIMSLLPKEFDFIRQFFP